ncbi:MAG: type II/IV secretion system protein [Pseudomonadales bacterium]|nr:type II/IV secretion system protein [Pseudomonadales bacterium]
MSLPDEKLKKLILKAGIISKIDLPKISRYAKRENLTLEEAIIKKELITDSDLGVLIASNLKIPFVDLSKIELNNELLSIIPERIAHTRKIIVFGRDDKTVKVALSDPENIELLKMIAHKTGLEVSVYYATNKDLEKSFIHYKTDYQQLFEKLLKEDRAQIITTVAYDPPVRKMVDLLVATAYRENASDIHIEPKKNNFLIRFRIDGILRDMATLPKEIHERVVTRIKVMSRLRIDEHFSSQDGKISTQVDNENLDLRISILPIADGEKIVIRLLASKSNFFSLSELGMNESDLMKVTKAFQSSFGMIICTGPTGSGKTTTIYTVIKNINTRDVNITSIEDPIEYRIQGANQVQVNEKTNLTFANGLRSILRQDPDKIFVGEIRDSETANIAVNAALTGHLVLSTLHTNNAATALPRLFDMDVEPFLVVSTVNLIIAQRLVRKICQHCKISKKTPMAEFSKFFSKEIINKYFKSNGKTNEIETFMGKGCRFCHDSGYSGRIGIYEILEVNDKNKDLIASKASAEDIENQAIKDGMTTMIDDGVQKIKDGMTTMEEVFRVTSVAK